MDPGSLRKPFEEPQTDQKTIEPETCLLRRSQVESSGNEMLDSSRVNENTTDEKYKVHMMQIDETNKEVLTTDPNMVDGMSTIQRDSRGIADNTPPVPEEAITL